MWIIPLRNFVLLLWCSLFDIQALSLKNKVYDGFGHETAPAAILGGRGAGGAFRKRRRRIPRSVEPRKLLCALSQIFSRGEPFLRSSIIQGQLTKQEVLSLLWQSGLRI